MKNYYPVLYLRNGDACIARPCANEQECRKEIAIAYAKYEGKVVGSTFMVREEPDIQHILGSPASRDIVRNPKAFREA